MSRTPGILILLVAVIWVALGYNNQQPAATISENNSAPTEEVTTLTIETPNADALKTLFTKLQEAIRANDTATAATITKGLFPDDASLRKAVKDSAAIEKIKAMHTRFSEGSDEQIAELFATDPGRTEIIVHGATTEDIAAYEEKGIAYAEFPGGAKEAAETILQPGMTFYEVELVEPGKDMGMKYHLFYHDGTDWKMLGPVWRALR